MSDRTRSSQILISDRETGLPFSKGLLASQIMVTGLSPYRAYQVAEEVELRLLEGRKASVSTDELADMTLLVIRELAGERYASNFVRWQRVEHLDVPVVILIGGATGVGKSTIATQLAARLGIVRVVATDAIREVMRAMLSPRADADAARLVVPGRPGDARAADQERRRAGGGVPGADGRRFGRDQRSDRAGGHRGHQHRDRGRPRRPGILRRGSVR